MPVAMIGRKLNTGPARSTPTSQVKSGLPKAVTTSPRVAPMDRRNPAVATSGTSRERNTRSRIARDRSATSVR